MSPRELREWILSFTDDIEFEYLDVHGSICPFSSNDIAVSYGEYGKEYDNIDAVMEDKFWDGKSLEEISEELDYYIK